MNRASLRPLSLDNLRAFDAVSRRLSFSAAADDLFLTQSAISRQIKALETELGATLFHRGTRKVELTAAGSQLLQTVAPALERIDHTVRQLRTAGGRRRVNVSTFASFTTLWLMPRLAGFQQQHPDIDIRISANDTLLELDEPEVDVLLRYDTPSRAPAGAERLFGEVVSPVASPWLVSTGPGLSRPADLAGHALFEEDSQRASAWLLSWRRWLQVQGLATLEPKRWVYLNYTHQQVQGALAGQGIALARLPLIQEPLARGELVEPFGPAGRIANEACYWMVPMPGARLRPELRAFIDWVRQEAGATRLALEQGDGSGSDAPGASQ